MDCGWTKVEHKNLQQSTENVFLIIHRLIWKNCHKSHCSLKVWERINEVGNTDLPETHWSTLHRRELENLLRCPLLAGFWNTDRENNHLKTPMLEHLQIFFFHMHNWTNNSFSVSAKTLVLVWTLHLEMGFRVHPLSVPLHASSWVVRTFLISFTQVVFTSAVGAWNRDS